MRRLARLVVYVSGWLVPRALRSRWREEWLGELESNFEVRSSNFELLRRVSGAPIDAVAARRLMPRTRDGRRSAVIARLDLTLAVRQAIATPFLSLAAVLALGVGISVTLSAFTVVKAALYGELEMPGGDRLVALRDYDRAGGWDLPVSLEEHERRRGAFTSFVDVAAHVERPAAVTLDGREQARRVGHVTPNTFRLLGVAPLSGRDLLDADAAPGAAGVALLGETLARQHASSPAALVGQTIRVDGRPRQIVGIIPQACRFPATADLWLPLERDQRDSTSPTQSLRVIGRLRPSTDWRTAAAELASVGQQMDLRPGEQRAQQLLPFGRLAEGAEHLFVGWAAVGAVTLLLLVSAASVANLLLARAAARRRDLAVRSALGASRGRLILGVVLEAAVLAAAASVLGFVGAHAALGWLGSVITDLPYWVTLELDFAAVAFAAVLALLISLAAGLGPAVKVTRGSVSQVLGQQRSTMRFGRLSSGLIVCETAIAVGFLCGGASLAQGLFSFSYRAYQLPEHQVLIAQLYFGSPAELLGSSGVTNAERDAIWTAFLTRARASERQLLSEIRLRPDVRASASVWQLPGEPRAPATVDIDGQPSNETQIVEATAGVFDVLGAGLSAGRDFTESDADRPATVAIVNEPFARRFFNNRSPLGARVKLTRAGHDSVWLEIVGVAPDLGLNPGDPARADGVYLPRVANNVVRLAIRTEGDAHALAPVIHELAGRLPLRAHVQWTRTLGEHLSEPVATLRGLGTSLLALGTVALLLACTGIYAIVAFSLTQRRRELAIRMALGAGAGQLARALLARTLGQLAGGAAAGAGLAWLLMRLVDTLPFSVAHSGVAHVSLAAALLVVAGLGACAGPLRRALTLAPLDSLRET